MGKIRILDDVLINRIAAGEVVERPSSVLKELVENSLDAGATTIECRLEGGGKRAIRVADDGAGMDRDDALLALERHATSKLNRSDDLTAIRTLGFRGEALPSIASVSRFVLRTAMRDGDGTEVEVLGGRIVDVRDVGIPRGTVVEVDRLFHNVPARRKFLRTDNTELAHAVRLLTRFALVRPDVRFRLEHGGRVLIDAPRAADAGERIRHLLGGQGSAELLEVALERPGLRIHGWTGRPVDAVPRRDAQHTFVNGRIVQDRVLGHAVTAAYGNVVPKGHHAALVLFVEIDPEGVDVNVHPQKAEVRFRRPAEVHDAVRDAVHAAFSRGTAVPSLGDLRPGFGGAPTVRGAADPVRRHLVLRDRPQAAEARGESIAPAPVEPARRPELPATADLFERPEVAGSGRTARALAQIRDSYIVAEDPDGLVLLDQHAAHERVLFERFLKDAETGQVETQRLAFPVVVELSAHEMPTFEDEREEFRRLGFLVEAFGERSVRLDGVPAVFAAVGPETLFRELLGEAGAARSATSASAPLRHRLVTTAACKAAIKIRRPMSLPEMQRLVEDLARVDNPSTCPHGRPALFRVTLGEIERAFRRA